MTRTFTLLGYAVVAAAAAGLEIAARRGAWATFGDASLHVRDSAGAIRAVRVQSTTAIPGDSVRLLGSTSIQNGQVVLKDASVLLLRTGVEPPSPDTVTTAEAAQALAGRLDADLVHLNGVVVQDTSRNAGGEFVMSTLRWLDLTPFGRQGRGL